MKKTFVVAILVAASISATSVMAQEREGRRDPKVMTARVAEKLNFTAEQKAQLEALNQKYPGADFDKEKYREDFKTILTDAQKKQLDEMRAKRMERRENGDAGKM
jgi:Spy/CpxP family protein refolding chaperone